jgi:hypothetical protein
MTEPPADPSPHASAGSPSPSPATAATDKDDLKEQPPPPPSASASVTAVATTDELPTTLVYDPTGTSSEEAMDRYILPVRKPENQSIEIAMNEEQIDNDQQNADHVFDDNHPKNDTDYNDNDSNNNEKDDDDVALESEENRIINNTNDAIDMARQASHDHQQQAILEAMEESYYQMKQSNTVAQMNIRTLEQTVHELRQQLITERSKVIDSEAIQHELRTTQQQLQSLHEERQNDIERYDRLQMENDRLREEIRYVFCFKIEALFFFYFLFLFCRTFLTCKYFVAQLHFVNFGCVL